MVAAVDARGTILRRTRADTPLDLDKGLALLMSMAHEVAGSDRVVAIGASAGGPLDWRSGVISPLHQPQWRGVPLAQLFATEFGCPLRVEVDTDAAALAEFASATSGKPIQPTRLLYVTISTGVGGGFIVDGQIYRGHDGTHPEVGHHAIRWRMNHGDPRALHCSCGATDCLESLVSGSAIRALYGKPAEELSEAEWNEVGFNLGQGLRNMAVILAPSVIVLGGGVAFGGGERLLREARQVMNDGLRLVPAPEVQLSSLGYDTALRGAISLALAPR